MNFEDIKKELEKHFPHNPFKDAWEDLEKLVKTNPFESIWEDFGKDINKFLRDELNLHNLPYLPIVSLLGDIEVGLRLASGIKQGTPAVDGLKTIKYTLDGTTAPAYEFLYGKKTDDYFNFDDAINNFKDLVKMSNPAALEKFFKDTLSNENSSESSTNVHNLTKLSLEHADQWAMAWTTYAGIYERAKHNVLDKYTQSLENIEQANEQFWPNIAQYGIGYNLLILQKVGDVQKSTIQKINKNIWTDDMEMLSKKGLLYFIDMSIFRTMQVGNVKGFDRFAPGTVIVLQQDPITKALTPISIEVSGYNGENSTVFTSANEAWLYALQAAKTSITVFGIWLGHVYQWHVLTGALFDTLKEMPSDKPIQKLIAPHTKYVREFNNFMIFNWKITPPTAADTPLKWLQLSNAFAENRNYHDDDPKVKLQQFGIKKEDFSYKKDWDVFPIAQQSIEIWDATEEYVKTFVDQYFKTDQDILDNNYLQNWIAASSDPNFGNIQGFSAQNKDELVHILTSLIYRVITHGTARMLPASHPLAMFVGNFPPCLQKSDIPSPDTKLTTKQLLSYMPKTGTISEVITFYYIFAFVKPYEPFIPLYGVDSQPFFDNDECNKALAKFRNAIINFIKSYSDEAPPELVQKYMWPMCVED